MFIFYYYYYDVYTRKQYFFKRLNTIKLCIDHQIPFSPTPDFFSEAWWHSSSENRCALQSALKINTDLGNLEQAGSIFQSQGSITGRKKAATKCHWKYLPPLSKSHYVLKVSGFRLCWSTLRNSISDFGALCGEHLSASFWSHDIGHCQHNMPPHFCCQAVTPRHRQASFRQLALDNNIMAFIWHNGACWCISLHPDN